MERLYYVWRTMKRRVGNKSHKDYKNYGGKGVRVCKEWEESYSTFRLWAINSGYNKDAKVGECTLDRIDNDGNYAPDNCRWVTMETQSNNRRYNHFYTHDGTKLTVAQWEHKLGMKRGTLSGRLRRGWSENDAFTRPVDVPIKDK